MARPLAGRAGGQATRIGISISGVIPGLYGAIAALAAINDRHLTGRGQHIDVSMLNSLVSILESVGMRALHDEEPVACGKGNAMSTSFGNYPAGRSSIAIAIAGDRLFPRLTEALNRPEWLEDERFREQTRRNEFLKEFRATLEQALRSFTDDEALELLTAHRGNVAIESDGFKTLASPPGLAGSVAAPPHEPWARAPSSRATGPKVLIASGSSPLTKHPY